MVKHMEYQNHFVIIAVIDTERKFLKMKKPTAAYRGIGKNGIKI